MTDNIPEQLKAARLAYGHSQQAAAAAMNLSIQTVHRWEAGHSKPSRLAMPTLSRYIKRAPRSRRLLYVGS